MSTPADTPTDRPWLRAARALGIDLAGYTLVWVAIGLVLLTINLAANGVWGEVDGSVWDGNASIFQYAMLAAGIMVVSGYVPVYVTHGLTRRDATTGGIVALIGLSLVAAVATTLGYGVEQLVFAVADWPHVLVENEHDIHIYDRPDQYGLIFVELFGLYVTHAIAGMLIVAGLFRLGWVFGGPLVLAGVGVAVGAELALGAGAAGVLVREWLDIGTLPTGVGMAVTAALAVAGIVLARRLLAGITIETKDAALWR